jgi:hypothetical protein
MGEAKRKQQNAAYGPALAAGVRGAVAKALPALTPERFDSLMRELFAVADSTLAAVVAKDPPRRTIACKAGCAYCCHLYVQVTPLEAIGLARAIRAQGAEALTAVKERVAATFAKTAGKDAAYRNVLALPCPLLVDGQCSVYAARPFVCRGANSADVDACRRGMGNASGVPLPTFVHQRTVYAAVGNGAAQGLRDSGVDPDLLELVAALRLALEHDDPLTAWRSGALDFTPALCVEVAKQRAS